MEAQTFTFAKWYIEKTPVYMHVYDREVSYEYSECTDCLQAIVDSWVCILFLLPNEKWSKTGCNNICTGRAHRHT